MIFVSTTVSDLLLFNPINQKIDAKIKRFIDIVVFKYNSVILFILSEQGKGKFKGHIITSNNSFGLNIKKLPITALSMELNGNNKKNAKNKKINNIE